MRYLVTARLKPGQADALADAIETRTLGRGSVAGGEYLRNMADARHMDDGREQLRRFSAVTSLEGSAGAREERM